MAVVGYALELHDPLRVIVSTPLALIPANLQPVTHPGWAQTVIRTKSLAASGPIIERFLDGTRVTIDHGAEDVNTSENPLQLDGPPWAAI